MPPENTQPNQGGVAQTPQPQGQSLDPSIVALTKSIGQSESGMDYSAGDSTNDGASSYGAYQMTPGFVSKWAPQILGSNYKAGSQLDPTQQNELAYGVVKTLGTTGDPSNPSLGKLSPAQIASYWNTNDPNAYLDPTYGTNNTYGSTQKYVDNVEKNFQSNSGSSASNSLIPSANAATSASGDTSSGSGPNWADVLLGGTAALGTWLWGKAAKPLQDAATDAAIGTVIDPGGGTLAGAGAGIVQGIVQDITGDGSGSTPSTTNTSTPAVPAPTVPDLTQSGNQIEPNKVPQETIVSQPTPTSPQTTPPPPQQQNPPLQNEPLDEENVATNANSQRLTQAIIQDYGSTVGGRKAMNDPNVMAGIEEMGMNGMGPEVVKDENGNHINDWSGGIDKANKMIGDTSDHMQQMLHASGSIGSMQDTLSDAERDFSQTRGIDASERKLAKEYFASKGKDYLAENGDGQGHMSSGHFQKMKQELGEGKKWDHTEANWKREADKSLSRAARRQVEKSVPKEMKELYNRANKKMQRLINAKNVMKKLDKKRGKINTSTWKKALDAGGKYAALYIGDKIGGPIGAILGSMVGDYVTRTADKKFGKTIFETPAMHKGLQILQKEKPKAYEVLQKELQKAGIVTPKLMLPSGKGGTIPMGPWKGTEGPAIVTKSKTPPKDYATAHAMKHGKPQFGGIYAKKQALELAKKAAYGTGRRKGRPRRPAKVLPKYAIERV